MDFLVACFIAYAVIVLTLYIAQRSLIYFPDNNLSPPSFFGLADMNVIGVRTSDGLTLKGWYKASADPEKPVILMFHGNAGHIGIRNFKARPFLDTGYGFLLAEYRAYGGNPGQTSEQGFYRDARAYIEWLRAQGVEPKDIVLYGESLGTGVVVQMAVEYPDMKAIVLETPFTSFVDLGKRLYFFLPVSLMMRDRYDNLAKIRNIKTPLLVLHGTADMVVPYRYGKALFDVAPEPRRMETFPAGGHNDLYAHDADGRILRFLEGLDKQFYLRHNESITGGE
ncbi:MAG: alpha/beta hydrolase [Proteobacteria bacterium]|nr:alpha/beta hydrolase [Pseudomonadota bacterium]